MSKAYRDFSVIRFYGEKAILTGTVTDATGARVNLTGFAIEVMAKERLADLDADAVFHKTVGSGVALLPQGATDTKGQFTVTIEESDYAPLSPEGDRSLYVDVQVNPSGDGPYVPLSGTFTVRRAVNRNED